MRQLELLMGADVFRDGLREYLKAHAKGNATWFRPHLAARQPHGRRSGRVEQGLGRGARTPRAFS
jgi:hypothetical protein